MPSALVVRLLEEMHAGLVEHESYSRKSLSGRCEPVVRTVVLALVAVLGGMVLSRSSSRRTGFSF